MIKTVISAYCDRCKKIFKTDGRRTWRSLESFGAAFEDTDWHMISNTNKTYCSDCWDYENDKPLKKTI